MSASSKSFEPYIKDFTFYKSRFANKHKEIKQKLREFATMVEKFESQNNNEHSG